MYTVSIYVHILYILNILTAQNWLQPYYSLSVKLHTIHTVNAITEL
jgi:hypothetical protein